MDNDYPLIVLSQPPYQGSAARSALDLALAFAVFNQRPRLLFEGLGALQLRAGQDPSTAGRKSLRKVIDSLPLYDIDEIYVAQSALSACGIQPDALPPEARILDNDSLKALRAGARHILSL